MNDLPTLRKMIEYNHPDLSLSSQCELLEIHRSSLYYTPVSESAENLEIMRILDAQYFETPFYGTERLLVHLIRLGFKINRKRVRRLMDIIGWQTLFPEPKTTISDPTHYKYPYLLKGLKAESSNQVWAIDITYIPMANGFLYLFAIIDLYTRYIVGWSLSNTMTSEWCIEAIELAIAQYGKPQIINSDQGSQFTSEVYVECLKSHEIQISMDGKGRAIDNIFIERFWRSVKYEDVYLHVYDTGKALFDGLSKYFLFYNRDRPHQSLEDKTPAELYLKAVKKAV